MIGSGSALYTELWKLCAGPLVDVPRIGERVFYFPQGHMEQVSYLYFFIFYFSSIHCSIFECLQLYIVC